MAPYKMWSCIDFVVFVFSFSLSVCFHSHTVAAPALSPSSSSPCPTYLRTAVMKSWRKRKRRIFQGFSLGPGISAKVCCMLQRAAWPLTTARCDQCWHCDGKKRDAHQIVEFDLIRLTKSAFLLLFLRCQLKSCALHKDFLGPFSSQQKCEPADL